MHLVKGGYMRVFRCLSALELTNIYKGKKDTPALIKGDNTHYYQEGIRYKHFFRYEEDAKSYFYRNHFAILSSLEHYVAFMVVNIPNNILDQYLGYGFYNNDTNILTGETKIVAEYAIPEELIKAEYIVEVNNAIECRGFCEGEYLLYLDMIKSLEERFNHDYDMVVDFLCSKRLQDILGVEDDPREEKEIDIEEAKDGVLLRFP